MEKYLRAYKFEKTPLHPNPWLEDETDSHLGGELSSIMPYLKLEFAYVEGEGKKKKLSRSASVS